MWQKTNDQEKHIQFYLFNVFCGRGAFIRKRRSQEMIKPESLHTWFEEWKVLGKCDRQREWAKWVNWVKLCKACSVRFLSVSSVFGDKYAPSLYGQEDTTHMRAFWAASEEGQKVLPTHTALRFPQLKICQGQICFELCHLPSQFSSFHICHSVLHSLACSIFIKYYWVNTKC